MECFNSQGGHFYECYGSGKKPFSYNDKYENNTIEILKLFGKWILHVTVFEEINQKK